jgi:hypothetical protein
VGFFKRRRERESAIPPGTLETGSIETAPAEPPPAPSAPAEPAKESKAEAPAAERTPPPAPTRTPPPPGDGSIADEVTAAAGGDLATHVRRLESLMAEHSVNIQKLPEKERKAVVRDLNRAGVPAKVDEPLEVTDIRQVQAIAAVLKKRGLLPEDADLAAA